MQDAGVEDEGVGATAAEVGTAFVGFSKQLRQIKAAALTPVVQQATHQLLNLAGADLTQRFDLVLQFAQQIWQQGCDGGWIHSSSEGAGLLHR